MDRAWRFGWTADEADERVTEIWRAGSVEVSREDELTFAEFPGLRLELLPVWRGLTELD